jgi:hypothetical protein
MSQQSDCEVEEVCLLAVMLTPSLRYSSKIMKLISNFHWGWECSAIMPTCTFSWCGALTQGQLSFCTKFQIQKLLYQNLEWHTELLEFYGCVFRITWAAKKLTAAVTKFNRSSLTWVTGSNQSGWLVVLLMLWDAWATWSIYFRYICRPVIWSGWTVRTLRLQPSDMWYICCCHPLLVFVTTTNVHNGRISDASALYVCGLHTWKWRLF